MARAQSLTVQQWVDAAYSNFEATGLSSVRVETVAKQLGATKGSFYWHFENRKSLVDAVMARWEAEETDSIIRVADTGSEPRERIERLFAEVAGRSRGPSGEFSLYLDADREGVRDVVARVTERRVRYLADILIELGLPADEAVRRGTIATAVAVGLQQLTVGVGVDGLAGLGRGRDITTTALAMMLAPVERG